ncbi:protein-lysine N-methyltransferase EEF2KMT [Anabrus simplex]|uniref:protein-lysine N-methyltransferase EEF2KMT n=1 Tax=Anabrus simplex TaxID=316456 RepID=UPI0035A38532
MCHERDVAKFDLVNIQRRFFSTYPVKAFEWDKLLDEDCGEEYQQALLHATVCHPLVKKYPLKISYMQAFLKTLIAKLETKGVEVCDAFYEMYCDILNGQQDRATHFRHYLLNSKSITIEESAKLISEGTTGLCSWQASQALANWCLSHTDELHNKCILELGAGVGLTGLAVSSACEPHSYWFTDCHPSVLSLLQSNVKLNCDGKEVMHEESSVLLSITLGNTRVNVMKLPWEEVAPSSVHSTIAPQVVLAADVVYDSTIFSPLCEALCHLLQTDECVAILACTVRNKETLDQFLELLKNHHLLVTEEEVAEPSVFIYPQDTPVKIYRIKNS